MKNNNRPLYVRLTEEERQKFDAYCDKVGVNYSIVVRAMVKDCLNRIDKGENIDLISGVIKMGRPTHDDK